MGQEVALVQLVRGMFVALADDLTGSCDAGVQFSEEGYKCRVLMSDKYLAEDEESDVTFVNTETRDISADLAYDKITRIVENLKKKGGKLVFKKIDSTLRGNIGAEMDALLDQKIASLLICAPSFPQQNRIVMEGIMTVDGTPLTSTFFAADSKHTVEGSYIPHIIEKQTQRKAKLVHIHVVRQGHEVLSKELKRLADDGSEIVIVDAEVTSDLDTIASSTQEVKAVPVGSAGLARATARYMQSLFRRPILVISGSVNPRSMLQLSHLRDRRCTGVHLSAQSLSRGGKAASDEVAVAADQASLLLAEGLDVALSTAFTEHDVSGESHPTVAEYIGETAQRILERSNVRALVLVGGTTAAHVLGALRANGIMLERELLPGISLGRIRGGASDGLTVVMKAGGFGDENVLSQGIELLRRDAI